MTRRLPAAGLVVVCSAALAGAHDLFLKFDTYFMRSLAEPNLNYKSKWASLTFEVRK